MKNKLKNNGKYRQRKINWSRKEDKKREIKKFKMSEKGNIKKLENKKTIVVN